MKNLKFIAIAIIFLITGYLLGSNYNLFFSNSNVLKTDKVVDCSLCKGEEQTITYILRYGDGTISEFQDVAFSKEQSVLDILKKLSRENNLDLQIKDYDNLGSLVEKIGVNTNGQDNKYWHYKVNGVLPNISANLYLLNKGDSVEWFFDSIQIN